jgi:hypothetical protein
MRGAYLVAAQKAKGPLTESANARFQGRALGEL